ncbi:hypothetical protein Tco_0922738 [Tanacetum coccineum]|uniref:Pentatricopeptide repeat-containing protein n=1 Tax=Tanacetum coccineum TaxID=301880 RepID=A0ABQ5D668_9ASTR
MYNGGNVVSCKWVMWSSFFSSCKEYGNVEFGREAAYKLFELERYSLVPYFILVDTYGGASLWNEVQNLRKMMIENGGKGNTVGGYEGILTGGKLTIYKNTCKRRC